MSGIPDSLIAAILYGAGSKMWTALNDPLANAIGKTITHFHDEGKGIEIQRERFAGLLEGTIGEEEIARFKDGEAFIDGDRLALEFAKLGDFYLPDESETLEVSRQIFSYFKKAFTSELLRDPRSSAQTLHNSLSIFEGIAQQERAAILKAIKSIQTESDKRPKPEPLWPGASFPAAGPRVVVPFAGRVEELEELTKAMAGEHKVVAVVGMAGQGKSCLTGQWYKDGARPPEGVGLFWRKVYESGFTFDRFLDELHVYLTGVHLNPQKLTSVEARAGAVQAALAEKPCWIVLDGAERWLKRWAAEPDAGPEGATVDDRAGHHPALDAFFKRANFWENGSKLLLTTRAVPAALDDNPPVRVGRKAEPDALLKDLKPDEAVELLTKLGVKGEKAVMLDAAKAYGNHAYAVHVLGLLIAELYGGDVAKWQEVNPVKDTKLEGLFVAVIEHRPEDRELLEYMAASVGPAPVRMLTELLSADEQVIRKGLRELARWQMLEFEKGEQAEQHTLVRKVMAERIGIEKIRELRKQIANWWVGREVPVNPAKREQIEPLIKAVEHLLAAREPLAAMSIFFSKPSAESYYSPGEWLWVFGYLDESIRICGDAIRVYQEVIEKEGRRELRNNLAMCYNNRGNALQTEGKLDEAIADFSLAIEIYEQLLKDEGRLELRNDLAMCYVNRGVAHAKQHKLNDAIADFSLAIEYYEQLVKKENRLELRNDLASSYNNRGGALRAQGKLDEAIADYGLAIEYYETLVKDEKRLELRNDLASSYNNRGIALEAQGKLDEAIADYGRAIDIYETLVKKENRLELRNDLAMSYNNRGGALQLQGKLDEAIADYGLAIEYYETLVKDEGRLELRNDLAMCYNNRGGALQLQGKLDEAIGDYGRAIEIYGTLVKDEGRLELRSDLVVCQHCLC